MAPPSLRRGGRPRGAAAACAAAAADLVAAAAAASAATPTAPPPTLLSIGCAAPAAVAAFHDDVGWPGTAYVDPHRDTYAALRTGRAVAPPRGAAACVVGAARAAAAAAAAAVAATPVAGPPGAVDPVTLQQGGVAVVAGGGGAGSPSSTTTRTRGTTWRQSWSWTPAAALPTGGGCRYTACPPRWRRDRGVALCARGGWRAARSAARPERPCRCAGGVRCSTAAQSCVPAWRVPAALA
ncbi:hypothetical protein BU14_0342s0012 [Porphyra umbilicalis]|uniref:Uncharacterized protein n=1 Tax=Porphyra umbilicalis TaxID=2786 RepID=A0A1X6NY31_PORUM|nr:hypothetical protein BU14_0342s0012 [Porphyra umbilicalis]|eukprot:OSX73492.1 hypothetical protein BU14_0342s0012 [Porphyra umbilicalis]